jgi:hypothetical protein
MDSTRTASQVFNNNPQGSWLQGRLETRWWNCIKQILMDAILKPGQGGPLRGQGAAMDYSTN